MSRVSQALQFLLVLFLTVPIAVLPGRLSLKIGEGLGSLLFYLWGSRRRIAIENLRGAVARGSVRLDSSAEDVIRENFRNLGRSFVEVVKVYYGLGDRIIGGTEIRGLDNFEKALAKGRGVLLITGHCGNWELNALTFGTRVTPMHVVARPVDNPYLNRILERTRKKYGNGVIYKQGALRKILSALRKNEVVGILMDQSVIRSEGVVTEFLGKLDYTAKTPALIARKTGAAVLPGFIRRGKRGHVIEIHEEVKLDESGDPDVAVLKDTVMFNAYIEDYIRENPSEWLWIHRRWKRITDTGKVLQPSPGENPCR